MEIAVIIVAVLYLSWFVYRLNIGKQKKKEERALLEAAKKKDASEWTETDRKLLLKDLEKNRQFLTFQQYDILKAKYSGTTSVTEMAIKNGYSPSQINEVTNASAAKTQTQRDSTKTIVKDAVVGGVIAGPAGAVVGAIVGKSKVDNDSKNSG